MIVGKLTMLIVIRLFIGRIAPEKCKASTARNFLTTAVAGMSDDGNRVAIFRFDCKTLWLSSVYTYA